ncbi:MAG: hypothetical protein Kow002_14070 [Anaerolineales bacterium]
MIRKTGLWLGVALVVLGCVSPFYSPPLLPTQPPGAIQTSIVGTADAAMAQTKAAQSPTPVFTPTLADTKTPTVTPTPTATVLFIYQSPTPVVLPPTQGIVEGTATKTSEKQFACELISRSPTRSVVYDRNEKFNAHWSLRNSGYQAWDHNSVDIEFVSGGHFHSQSSYDMPKRVGPKSTVTVIIPLTAPKNPGEYGATWTLKVGKKEFCRLRLDFTVR